MREDSSFYPMKHHPEACDRDDLWRQVGRTTGGKPVSSDQIELIVAAATENLSLKRDDVLLDLCCGNGALTTHLFQVCQGGLGVDYSEVLIDIALQRFAFRDTESYLLADALRYLRAEPQPERFTKAMCYGAFPYFPPPAAQEMLTLLHERFSGIERIFIGQLPDKSRIDAFYVNGVAPGIEADPGGPLGLWRTSQEMESLAAAAGWTARCVRMPDAFFSAHYRFDAVLTRR
jgi:SAM-dependent methyltransferase